LLWASLLCSSKGEVIDPSQCGWIPPGAGRQAVGRDCFSFFFSGLYCLPPKRFIKKPVFFHLPPFPPYATRSFMDFKERWVCNGSSVRPSPSLSMTSPHMLPFFPFPPPPAAVPRIDGSAIRFYSTFPNASLFPFKEQNMFLVLSLPLPPPSTFFSPIAKILSFFCTSFLTGPAILFVSTPPKLAPPIEPPFLPSPRS